MSGKLVTCVVLSICAGLVTYSVCQRSRNTRQIRGFWTGQGASNIQHAPTVWLVHSNKTRDQNLRQDVSATPGLVHLRATLTDDRYFDWTTLCTAATDTSRANGSPAGERIVLVFESGQTKTEVSFEIEHGTVISIASNMSVQLIPASHLAVRQYLQSWQPTSKASGS